MSRRSGWVADDEITDRQAYERQVVDALTRYAAGDWREDRLKLAAVTITGSYPDTLLEITVEQPGRGTRRQTTVAVWAPEHGRVNPNRVWRWSPEFLAAAISDGIVEELTACS